MYSFSVCVFEYVLIHTYIYIYLHIFTYIYICGYVPSEVKCDPSQYVTVKLIAEKSHMVLREINILELYCSLVNPQP